MFNELYLNAGLRVYFLVMNRRDYIQHVELKETFGSINLFVFMFFWILTNKWEYREFSRLTFEL